MNNQKLSVKIHSRVFNKIYLSSLKNKKRYEIFYGGAGSGKSVFIAQRMLVRHLNEFGHKTLVVRKVARTNRHSTFSLLSSLISEWDLKKLFKIKESDMEISCINGNRIIFAGLDDVEKLKSIAGITDIWIEEASEITYSDFKQLDLRLRGKTKNPKQITLSFNPVSINSWLKKHFFDNPKENYSILKTTYLDNKFLDEEYIQVMEELKDEDEIMYQIYALGNWGVIGNLIYTNYEVVRKLPQSFDEIIYGLDFGFNNPSALIQIGIKDEVPWIINELYETRLTNEDLISRLPEYVEDKKQQPIYADNAEPDRIEEISKSRYLIYPADKSVEDGLDFVKRKKLKIFHKCINTIGEIQGYKYKEDKDGNVLDMPVKFKDHAMDAIRYALYTHSKVRRPKRRKRAKGNKL